MNLFLSVVDQMAPWCFGWLGEFRVHCNYTLLYSPSGDVLYFQLLSSWSPIALIFMWTSEIIKHHEYRPWDWHGEEKSLIKFSVLSSVFSTSSCTRYKTSKRWKKSLNSVSSNYSIQEMWPKKYFSGLVFPNCSNVAVALLSIMTSQKCHLPLKSL